MTIENLYQILQEGLNQQKINANAKDYFRLKKGKEKVIQTYQPSAEKTYQDVYMYLYNRGVFVD